MTPVLFTVGGLVLGVWVVLLAHLERTKQGKPLTKLLWRIILLYPAIYYMLNGQWTYVEGGNLPEEAGGTGTAATLIQLLAGLIALTLILTSDASHRRKVAVASLVVPLCLPPILLSLVHASPERALSAALPALCIAALALSTQSTDEAVLIIRNCLRIYVWVTVALLLLAPEAMLAPPERSSRSFFGLSTRLVGPTGGPQYMGILMAVSIAVELYGAKRLRALLPHVGLAGAFCIWTQSRLSIGIALGIAAIMLTYRARAGNRNDESSPHVKKIWYPILSLTLLVIPLLAAPAISARLNDVLNQRASIWRLAIEIYLQHPILGYGPNLFTSAHSLEDPRVSLLDIANAHSQILQSLAMFGVIGAAGATLYILLVSSLGVKYGPGTRGLTLAASLLIVTQVAFSTPLNIFGLSFNIIPNAIIVTILTCAASVKPSVESPKSGSAPKSSRRLGSKYVRRGQSAGLA